MSALSEPPRLSCPAGPSSGRMISLSPGFAGMPAHRPPRRSGWAVARSFDSVVRSAVTRRAQERSEERIAQDGSRAPRRRIPRHAGRQPFGDTTDPVGMGRFSPVTAEHRPVDLCARPVQGLSDARRALSPTAEVPKRAPGGRKNRANNCIIKKDSLCLHI